MLHLLLKCVRDKPLKAGSVLLGMLWVCLQQPWDTHFQVLYEPSPLASSAKLHWLIASPTALIQTREGYAEKSEDGLSGQVCLTTALKTLLPFSRALPDVIPWSCSGNLLRRKSAHMITDLVHRWGNKGMPKIDGLSYTGAWDLISSCGF